MTKMSAAAMKNQSKPLVTPENRPLNTLSAIVGSARVNTTKAMTQIAEIRKTGLWTLKPQGPRCPSILSWPT